MKNLILTALSLIILTVGSIAFANNADLLLENEKYKTVFHRYVCSSVNEKGIDIPLDLMTKEIVFERLSLDSKLNHALVLASYRDGSELCRYSAILSRDRASKTLVRSDSNAFAISGTNDC